MDIPNQLEEFFYMEVGRDHRISLEGFIAKVKEEYEKSKSSAPKIYSFDSKGTPESLQLIVAKGYDPFIAGVTIKQSTENLDELLANLSGEVKASFPVDKRIKKSINGLASYSTANGYLTDLAFSTGADHATVLLACDRLDKPTKNLIYQAELIKVEAHQHSRAVKSNVLVHSGCEIHCSQRRYQFQYQIVTADLSMIPESYYPQASAIFNMVADKFTRIVAYRGGVKDFTLRRWK